MVQLLWLVVAVVCCKAIIPSAKLVDSEGRGLSYVYVYIYITVRSCRYAVESAFPCT